MQGHHYRVKSRMTGTRVEAAVVIKDIEISFASYCRPKFFSSVKSVPVMVGKSVVEEQRATMFLYSEY